MNIRPLKIFVVILTLFLLSSCAVFVRDRDHHHRGHWHHSSLQQSDQSTSQMTAQSIGDSEVHNQMSR
jgi:hypothetical protein